MAPARRSSRGANKRAVPDDEDTAPTEEATAAGFQTEAWQRVKTARSFLQEKGHWPAAAEWPAEDVAGLVSIPADWTGQSNALQRCVITLDDIDWESPGLAGAQVTLSDIADARAFWYENRDGLPPMPDCMVAFDDSTKRHCGFVL